MGLVTMLLLSVLVVISTTVAVPQHNYITNYRVSSQTWGYWGTWTYCTGDLCGVGKRTRTRGPLAGTKTVEPIDVPTEPPEGTVQTEDINTTPPSVDARVKITCSA